MFSEIKNKITKQKSKVSNYVFNPLFRSIVDHTVANQTDLQLVHVHLITFHFLVILPLKHFAFGSFLIESGPRFQERHA